MWRQRVAHNASGRGPRGAVLIVVMVTAFLIAIAIYTTLFLAISQARYAVFYRSRTQARYAAEAGLVWAQQRLWQTPSECFGASPDWTLPTTPPTNIEVTRTPCPGPPPSTLTATVTY